MGAPAQATELVGELGVEPGLLAAGPGSSHGMLLPVVTHGFRNNPCRPFEVCCSS